MAKIKATLLRAGKTAGSDVWGVQVGVVDAPVGREVLLCVALYVPLHGNQAAAELQAYRALVGWSPAMGAKVLDHGGVVPGALTTETTLEGFLSSKRRERVCTRRKMMADNLISYRHKFRCFPPFPPLHWNNPKCKLSRCAIKTMLIIDLFFY